MLKFNKVNENLFNVETDGLETLVNDIMDKITLCGKDAFSNEIEGELKDKIVSRIVASSFKKEFPNYLDNNSIFIKLIVPFNGKKVNVTYGEILHNEKTRILNGVLYS